jgi:hypothetical protein
VQHAGPVLCLACAVMLCSMQGKCCSAGHFFVVWLQLSSFHCCSSGSRSRTDCFAGASSGHVSTHMCHEHMHMHCRGVPAGLL